MKQLPLPLSRHQMLCPQLVPLAILDVALTATESALVAANSVAMHHDAFDRAPRQSPRLRANAVILQSRRLAAAISAYRDALEREARRADRDLNRMPF